MSSRGDIRDGSEAETARYGLVYTCLAGWVDLGHAAPTAARGLWQKILVEDGPRTPDGIWFQVRFEECMGVKKWGHDLVKACEGGDFAVRVGLPTAVKRSVALAIFLNVSMRFETMQGSFPYNLKTADSSFSVEDLVSNLIGFYRAVLPAPDHVSRCQPVSKAEAEGVWDTQGAVGTHKNRDVRPVLFPCGGCVDAPLVRSPADLPPHLNQIQPVAEGDYWDSWLAVVTRRFCVPPAPLPGAAAGASVQSGTLSERMVHIGRGETLSMIAAREYASVRQPALLWPVLFDANPDFGRKPNVVREGYALRIPSLAGMTESTLERYRERGRAWRQLL